ncbi:hypothetical protein RJ639_029981 [Escallonia herrerae]|uniref:Uncharacterized protein n=1 Tax=Escallonia herrerae TaxID=1293975 RepID=A0AA89BHS9_9ASTE|nr:hypothetical protein RJ639_029981 [Escallonia herrerae]
MLDPANELLPPPPPSPSISSISSSDLDTVSTGSFFHDRSTTLGTLMGVNFPAITFRAPSQHRDAAAVHAGNNIGAGGRRSKKGKRGAASAAEDRRRRRWWGLCRDDDLKPSSLGEFLEVERRFGDGGFAAELEAGGDAQPGNGRLLFADGRVLPPADAGDGTPVAGALCRFPASLTGICSGGAG